METVDIVFVVLTYRNSDDLAEFFSSLKNVNGKLKAIVVDAFFEEETSNRIQEIAKRNNSQYIRIPNKGYSYGNNKGIEFAIDNYQFDYLVVSNPDTEIKDLDISTLNKMPSGCYGPMIIAKGGKKQNPMYIREHLLSRKIVYKGLKKDNKGYFLLGIAFNKIQNAAERIFLRKTKEVYQLHGSFLIFSQDIILRLYPVFDEKMFLFAEESYLAKRLQSLGIRSFYVPSIIVFHKEDGSMQFLNDITGPLKDANIYVFEKYYLTR